MAIAGLDQIGPLANDLGSTILQVIQNQNQFEEALRQQQIQQLQVIVQNIERRADQRAAARRSNRLALFQTGAQGVGAGLQTAGELGLFNSTATPTTPAGASDVAGSFGGQSAAFIPESLGGVTGPGASAAGSNFSFPGAEGIGLF